MCPPGSAWLSAILRSMRKLQARQAFGLLDFFLEGFPRTTSAAQDLKRFIGVFQMCSLTTRNRCSIEKLLAESDGQRSAVCAMQCNACVDGRSVYLIIP